MSANPPITQIDVAAKKSRIFYDKRTIEFEFNRITRGEVYDDIVIRIYDQENSTLSGRPHNPFFVRDNTLFTYYKTNDAEYIKIVDAIGKIIANIFNLKVVSN